MYIQIERNNRGLLMVDKNVINKLILFGIVTQIDKDVKVEVKTWIHQENGFFALVEFYISNSEEVSINEKEITATINEVIDQTLNLKPKNISYAYIHKNKK
ncbi:hypothetical protein SSABA_v1c02990 [Spiroplasma sabaudiense Ar-1343]|uniref:Uncharacterized protein n=1 Tax=Spiroplasma sabaudiense Ar-1343 TaxID=1276257 RepID=W6A9R8_9MOLU|nr:hypothetical protein [Spiroplasma sabaudiense]AHI53711.1 hypothetical protein SSABA_v1c02990 [Spiroplasma sabaudiense Ar-1343]